MEPEVVATSPSPVKSRVPVYCGFGSKKVLPAGFAPATARIRSPACMICYTSGALENLIDENGSPAWTRTTTWTLNRRLCYFDTTGETKVAAPAGFSPATWPLEAACSENLSYGAMG